MLYWCSCDAVAGIAYHHWCRLLARHQSRHVLLTTQALNRGESEKKAKFIFEGGDAGVHSTQAGVAARRRCIHQKRGGTPVENLTICSKPDIASCTKNEALLVAASRHNNKI